MPSPKQTGRSEIDPAAASLIEAAFESAPTGIALLAADGSLVRANRALARMLGTTAGELTGEPLPWVQPEVFAGALSRALSADGAQRVVQAILVSEQGDRLPVRVRIEVVRGDGSEPIGAVVHVFEGAAAEQARAGERDPLTGLLTKAELERRFMAMLAAGERGALLRVDVDDFEAVNERYGRRAGDQVLISVSEELRRCVRRSDEIARVEGDEFALLLRGADRTGAKKVGGAVMAALARVRYGEGRSLAATVGYALTGQGENRSGELDSLLAEARRQRVPPGKPRVPADASA